MKEQSRNPQVGDYVHTAVMLSADFNLEMGTVISVVPNAGRRHETLYVVEFEFGNITLTAEQMILDSDMV